LWARSRKVSCSSWRRGSERCSGRPHGDSYGFFSADPSGSHFLLGTGTLNGPLAGRIGNGMLIPLRPDPVVVQAMVW
jgi:hypothetical protein